MHVIEFDFESKQERQIPAADVAPACAAGRFCWVDIDREAEPDAVKAMLAELRIAPEVADEITGPDIDGRHDVYDDVLHFTLTSLLFVDGKLCTYFVDVAVGERYLLSIHHGKVEFLERVRRIYRRDFLRFARSGGFLLYEYWDQLIHGYRKAFRALDRQSGKVQEGILNATDDSIFEQAARIQADMVTLRKSMLAAREVLHEMITRRTSFVSESTVPSLERLAGALDRLVADLTTERESLAETLNLYMGIVAHRTNRVINRLTVLNAVFLPLTFLVGMYGVNFPDLPGTQVPGGYYLFWLACILIAAGLLFYMRRKKWL
ncbi:magnesium transporter CorA family protein [Humisphaera borealis]|uniref:Magnesium transporter CorA family protein n=1 Tax=Humisphaera borealis TaxID=2807512 RepID=A0A7M2WZZ5_9BACT|nr:CorA family divalent cation transporter [Humisphaera borealis]QOV90050.1 hypothetical protein IPV69_01360 [Humisphaera borealis]